MATSGSRHVRCDAEVIIHLLVRSKVVKVERQKNQFFAVVSDLNRKANETVPDNWHGITQRTALILNISWFIALHRPPHPGCLHPWSCHPFR